MPASGVTIDTLPELIVKMGGQSIVGRMLGVPRRTVHWWCKHGGMPKQELASKLLTAADRLKVDISPGLRGRLLGYTDGTLVIDEGGSA